MQAILANGTDDIVRVALVNFHLEYEVSGESESIRSLHKLLRLHSLDAQLLDDRTAFGAAGSHNSEKERVAGKALATFRLLRHLASAVDGYDIVQLHLPTPAFGFVADLVAARISVPLIVRYDGLLNDVSLTEMTRLTVRNPAFFLPRLIFNSRQWAKFTKLAARAYVVSSDHQFRQLVQAGYPADRLHRIPNTIDAAKLELSLHASSSFNQAHDHSIGYFGHLFPNKGLHVLLKALTKINHATRLSIAQSGLGSLDSIRHLVKVYGLQDRVDFVGKVRIADFIASHQLIVLPYTQSFGTVVFPNALLEAMASGAPVVTSALPLMNEFPEGVVALAPPDSPEELASTISSLLIKDDVRLRLGHRGRDFFCSHFSPDTIARAYRDLYSRTLNG
jgi:glycosyltransferase involved in cell wall biosynthesis